MQDPDNAFSFTLGRYVPTNYRNKIYKERRRVGGRDRIFVEPGQKNSNYTCTFENPFSVNNLNHQSTYKNQFSFSGLEQENLNNKCTYGNFFSVLEEKKLNNKFPHENPFSEKMVQHHTIDLKNVAESQSLHSVSTPANPLAPASLKTNKKPENNSDAPSNSPMPLIKVSRIIEGMPQSPHFFQLRKYSKSAREKLIEAWDQVFEETSQKVHDLKAKDFWVNARKLWKTMEDLQGMGYNVIPIRRRLVEMTEIMVEFENSKMNILMLKNKAENHRMEKSRLESVVMSVQLRAEREGMTMVKLLGEVDQIEKTLPRYDVLVKSLAIKAFDVDV